MVVLNSATKYQVSLWKMKIKKMIKKKILKMTRIKKNA